MKCDRCDNEANVTVKAIINGTEHDLKSLVINLSQALIKLLILIMIIKFPKTIFPMIIFHH